MWWVNEGDVGIQTCSLLCASLSHLGHLHPVSPVMSCGGHALCSQAKFNLWPLNGGNGSLCVFERQWNEMVCTEWSWFRVLRRTCGCLAGKVVCVCAFMHVWVNACTCVSRNVLPCCVSIELGFLFNSALPNGLPKILSEWTSLARWFIIEKLIVLSLWPITGTGEGPSNRLSDFMSQCHWHMSYSFFQECIFPLDGNKLHLHLKHII